jgi:hypothetical protein
VAVGHVYLTRSDFPNGREVCFLFGEDLKKVKVGDIVKGWDGDVGIITHMSNQLGPGHAWVYVTVLWSDIGPHLEKSNNLEIINESR